MYDFKVNGPADQVQESSILSLQLSSATDDTLSKTAHLILYSRLSCLERVQVQDEIFHVNIVPVRNYSLGKRNLEGMRVGESGRVEADWHNGDFTFAITNMY
jgi:hypothetical protein